MMKMVGTGILLVAAASLLGCMGHSRKYSQQNYWKHAQVISPVVIPSDIRVKPTLGLYPAPRVEESGSNRQPSLVPPGSQIRYYQHLDRMKNKGHN